MTIDPLGPLGLRPPLLAQPVQDGAQLIQIPGISGVPVTNGTHGPLVLFRWPQRLILRRFILVPQSALAADAANLQLQIIDTQGVIIFDGSGVAAEAQFLPMLAQEGIAPQPFRPTAIGFMPNWTPFARLVMPGDQWKFAIANTKVGGGSLTPRLTFDVEIPV